MVVKPAIYKHNKLDQFESRVILDGSQTDVDRNPVTAEFESRVILDGSQTALQN